MPREQRCQVGKNKPNWFLLPPKAPKFVLTKCDNMLCWFLSKGTLAPFHLKKNVGALPAEPFHGFQLILSPALWTMAGRFCGTAYKNVTHVPTLYVLHVRIWEEK